MFTADEDTVKITVGNGDLSFLSLGCPSGTDIEMKLTVRSPHEVYVSLIRNINADGIVRYHLNDFSILISKGGDGLTQLNIDINGEHSCSH